MHGGASHLPSSIRPVHPRSGTHLYLLWTRTSPWLHLWVTGGSGGRSGTTSWPDQHLASAGLQGSGAKDCTLVIETSAVLGRRKKGSGSGGEVFFVFTLYFKFYQPAVLSRSSLYFASTWGVGGLRTTCGSPPQYSLPPH
mmetsp:Transcript_45595/g.84743  ORF Transcript_45595/g.84743 Transcript_45595/m.84743 type:complete len:140 (-) Transcript_45595:49-468(-)